MHKCVRCGTIFSDEDSSILRGCTKCGSIFFFYLKTQQDFAEAKQIEEEFQAREKSLEEELQKKIEEKKEEEKIEREVKKEVRKKREIKFGVETVRIPREGVYEINLDALMKKKPLIILEKGKIYLIHLPSVFEARD